jgi:signal transduction histidine kinase
MTDDLRRRDRLGTRLGAAFTATAVGAVAVATVLALVTSAGGFDDLVVQQRDDVVSDVVDALATAYEEADGWEDADLLPAHVLAASAGAVLVVETSDGDLVPVPPEVAPYQDRIRRRDDPASPTPTVPPDGPAPTEPTDGPGPSGGPGPTDGPGPTVGPSGPQPSEGHGGEQRTSPPREGDAGGQNPRPEAATVLTAAAVQDVSEADEPTDVDEERTAPIVVDDEVVGTARLLFTAPGQLDPIPSFRRSLTRNLLVAGAVAALLGLAVATWVTPRLTRPLRRLTATVDRIARGDRGARARLPDDARTVGELRVLAAAVDRMAADIERGDRLRRTVVADVAHEVRTPLSVLQGEIEALEDGVAEPDPEHLASLHEEVVRLARLLDDLDAIAAAEAAGLDMHIEPLDLADVVDAARTGLAERFVTDDVTIDTDLVPAPVLGDRRRLEQIVRNLLTNAARFSPPGGHISVTVRPDDADAVLRVVDDGLGIPEDELPHVFERFWRGRHAAGTSGSGIGLAVVAELTAAHGGRVTAGNAAGRGASFEVRLPRS